MEVESLISLVDAEIFPLLPADDKLLTSYCIIDHFDIINTEDSEEDEKEIIEENSLH
jgi:hypothetical protein